MNAVRYRTGGGDVRLGRLDGETITDAGPSGPEGFVPTPENWRLIADASGPTCAVGDVELLHPVEPRKILAIGLNYRDHAEESELEIPEVPVVFSKATTALIGQGETIVVPREETRPDWEAELAVVIGRRCKNVSRAEALDYVLGYTCGNDVSARDWQRNGGGGQWCRGKSFATFCPLGPSIVTTDEIPDPNKLSIRTLLNGQVMQDWNKIGRAHV